MSGTEAAKGCPPNASDYDVLYGGSYAQQMLWRGFVPIAGPFMQQSVNPPTTCEQQNRDLASQIDGSISAYQLQASDTIDEVWNAMRIMLADMTYMSAVVSDVRTTPLQFKLLYLFAGATALALLSVAILLSI